MLRGFTEYKKIWKMKKETNKPRNTCGHNQPTKMNIIVSRNV